MRVIFMGTPQFAVPSLQALLVNNFEVVAVYCQPDRPKGRSGKLQACPVKLAALQAGIEVFQPDRLRAKTVRLQLESQQPDLVVVAAYGQILSQKILDIPKWGCLNVHASLLPRWRGASPIHAAIAAGDEQTGVGIMKMTKGLDEGPVYQSKAIEIPPKKGRLALERQLADLGANLLIDTIAKLPQLTATPQQTDQASYAPIIKKSMGYCQFSQQTASQLEHLMRAFEEWPQMQCGFRDKTVKLIAGQQHPSPSSLPPGSFLPLGKKNFGIVCAQGTVLQIEMLQVAGKKPMDPPAFLNGYRPEAGESFTPTRPEDYLPFP